MLYLGRIRSVFFTADATALFLFFFFFNDTATTEIYTLSLYDALPISPDSARPQFGTSARRAGVRLLRVRLHPARSEEHTSELQSRPHLVCRLLLEKKKKNECRTLIIKKKKQGL